MAARIAIFKSRTAADLAQITSVTSMDDGETYYFFEIVGIITIDQIASAREESLLSSML